MNVSKLLLAASLTALTAAAGAQTVTAEGSYLPEPLVASVSRAQVQAELAQYRQAGVNPWSTSYDQLRYVHPELSRAEVRAEAQRSREQIDAFTGEDSGSAYLAQGKARRVSGTNLAGTASRAE